MIRPVTTADSEAITRIYNHYVLNTIITFEEQPIAATEMMGRIQEIFGAGLPWLVLETAEGVTGYAYAGRWKTRSAYRLSVESTIYLDPVVTGSGHGLALYSKLISELRDIALHTVIGGIALPNLASVALHEKLGFRKVAHFEQTGWKFEKWIDVGYWQLLLD